MFFKWIEHLPSKEAVIGSNPIGLTSTLRIATKGFCLLAPTPIGLATKLSENKPKKISKIDIKSLCLIEEFDSIAEAAISTGNIKKQI